MGGVFYFGLYDRLGGGGSYYRFETGLKVYLLVIEFKYKTKLSGLKFMHYT